MYTPVLNANEKARELVDIVRQQTDAPINVCIETVSVMLGALLTDLPAEQGLRSIRNALAQDEIVDVDNCYDAHLLQALITELTDNIEDKEQQSWTIRDDEQILVDALNQFSSILKNADRRVCLKHLRQSDFCFVQRLVALYQIDQRGNVSLAVLKALQRCCELDTGIVSLLLCSNLPVILIINNKFSAPLSELQTASIEMLCALFSTTEKPPFTHYVVETLRRNHSLAFGQLLIDELNRLRNANDLNAMKMVFDVFTAEPEIISTTFYDNDLRVLGDVLCQDLLDTDIREKITMILEVLERMSCPNGHGDKRQIGDSLQTLLLSKEISDDHKQRAESILRLCQSE